MRGYRANTTLKGAAMLVPRSSGLTVPCWTHSLLAERTYSPRFVPKCRMSRRVAFLIFPDFQLLDAAGPISAFEIAERYRPGSYELRLIAPQKGLVASTSGVTMNASAFGRAAAIDTLIIAGGEGTRPAALDPRIVKFVRRCGVEARRVASVCSGAYILA